MDVGPWPVRLWMSYVQSDTINVICAVGYNQCHMCSRIQSVSFGQPALSLDLCYLLGQISTANSGETESPALWHRACQESATCACGHITQSVQHVVVDCMIHKAPDGFAGLRCPDAATRFWLEDLNIEIWRTGKRLYIYNVICGVGYNQCHMWSRIHNVWWRTYMYRVQSAFVITWCLWSTTSNWVLSEAR